MNQSQSGKRGCKFQGKGNSLQKEIPGFDGRDHGGKGKVPLAPMGTPKVLINGRGPLNPLEKTFHLLIVSLYFVNAGNRTAEVYRQAFEAALAFVGLDITHVFCSVSDHEGAVRKGLRLLGAPAV